MLRANRSGEKMRVLSPFSSCFFPSFPFILPRSLASGPIESPRPRCTADLAAVAAWWASQHNVAAAAKAAGAAPQGWVTPPDAFDVVVAPGRPLQAAVDGCPPGGSVLLLPGTHEGPLVLGADHEVHIFGRGRAVLRTNASHVVISEAVVATLDGLILRRESDNLLSLRNRNGVEIRGGRLRLQACDVACDGRESGSCVYVQGGADPTLASCTCV